MKVTPIKYWIFEYYQANAFEPTLSEKPFTINNIQSIHSQKNCTCYSVVEHMKIIEDGPVELIAYIPLKWQIDKLKKDPTYKIVFYNTDYYEPYYVTVEPTRRYFDDSNIKIPTKILKDWSKQ